LYKYYFTYIDIDTDIYLYFVQKVIESQNDYNTIAIVQKNCETASKCSDLP